MKKILLLLLLIFSVFMFGCSKNKQQTSLEAIKEKGYITVGTKFETKPFGYIENGELKGFDIDIARKVAKEIFDDETKVEFIEVTSENRISKLMNEEIDIIIATMSDTPDRREIVDFSRPYYISGQAVLCKKDSEVNSVADLSNHNAVVVIGTTAEKTLRNLYQRSNIIRALTYNEAFNNINKNTCMIADEAILQGFVIDNNNYKIYSKKLSKEPYAVAVRKGEDDLKNIINTTINELESSGDLDLIQDKWIK